MLYRLKMTSQYDWSDTFTYVISRDSDEEAINAATELTSLLDCLYYRLTNVDTNHCIAAN